MGLKVIHSKVPSSDKRFMVPLWIKHLSSFNRGQLNYVCNPFKHIIKYTLNTLIFFVYAKHILLLFWGFGFFSEFLNPIPAGGSIWPPPLVFLHNSKSIGLRLLKFSDFSYIPKALPLGQKPGFNTNCLSPQAHCQNDCFFL